LSFGGNKINRLESKNTPFGGIRRRTVYGGRYALDGVTGSICTDGKSGLIAATIVDVGVFKERFVGEPVALKTAHIFPEKRDGLLPR